MDKEIVGRLHSSFKAMVQKEPRTGTEYWLARDLQVLLGYTQWRSFEAVIRKVMTACENSGYDSKDHFAHARKMVDLGSGAVPQEPGFPLAPRSGRGQVWLE